MAKYNPRRSGLERLRLITKCHQSGMLDNAWCEQHDIPVSSFYNAVTRLRKVACDIPESATLSGGTYALDFTARQDVVRVNICLYPETATSHTDVPGAVVNPDRLHTVELMTSGITVQLSNSRDPGLLAAVFRLLKG